MAGIVLKSPEVNFLNFEARFSPSFLDAPAWIELWGFEEGGGGNKTCRAIIIAVVITCISAVFLFFKFYNSLLAFSSFVVFGDPLEPKFDLENLLN
jgi:hypothetical protein